jgi:hypothetical protein
VLKDTDPQSCKVFDPHKHLFCEVKIHHDEKCDAHVCHVSHHKEPVVV